MPPEPRTSPNPPIDYAVAVWLGMPDDEVARGLREGWIRGPQTHAAMLSEAVAPLPPVADKAHTSPDDASATSPRDRVQRVLRRLDASLDEATFEAVWSEAGPSDALRWESIGAFLGRSLGTPAISADDGYVDFAAIETAALSASGEARLIRLASHSGGELEALAHDDTAVRAALAMHFRWALAGDRALASAADPAGRYDRFDRDTGESLLSDPWIADRAKHAAWSHAAEAGRPLETSSDGWRFVDRSDAAATVELAGATPDVMHQVVFARDDGDSVTGGTTTDRIHGGDGDDVLRGRGGDDLVEGGRGDDEVLGGSGRDSLAGQQGNDVLDGGAGDDRLDAGGGDDELEGGRGDDVLRGGTGSDVYRFGHGDGTDTIADDGGTLVFDDVALAGTMRREGNGWSSADGRFRFALEGSLDAGGTLTIRAREATETDAVRIAGWRQDAFGFSLEAPDDASEDDIDPHHESDGAHDARGEPSAWYAGDTTEPAPPRPPFDIPRDDGPPDVPVPPEIEAIDLSSLTADSLDAGALVDFDAAARAIDQWTVPSPPDVGALQTSDAPGIGLAEIVDALAGDVIDDGDDYAALPLHPTAWPASLEPLGTLDPTLLPTPPGFALRKTH